MSFKKTFLSLLLISCINSTIQSDNIKQEIENNDLEGIKIIYNKNPESMSETFLDNDSLEMISPIHKAAITANNPEILKLLLQKGANVNKRSESEKTPLFYALKYNPNPTIANFLINQGARLNVVDEFGNSLFHALMNSVLSIQDQKEFITKLFNAGVSASQKNKAGINPFTSKTLNQAIFEQLQDSINRELAQALSDNTHEESAQMLTDDDICIVCLEPVQSIESTVYKTNCCKHFLCQNCAQGMQATAERRLDRGLSLDTTLQSLISCPMCRANPLTLKEFNKNTGITSSDEISLPHNF